MLLRVDDYEALARERLDKAAVLIGRAYLWGLPAAGEQGVRDVLRLLHDELRRAMAFAGRTSIASIDRSLVQRANGAIR